MDEELLQDFLDGIRTGDHTDLEGIFDDLVKVRIADVLDQRRNEIAQEMFNDNSEEE